MKVSIRHGHGIPRNDDIKIPYGFGWDESDRKFGEGNGGKTLYIKDPSTNKPIEITAGLLKKEFLNYVFPISTNEDGTAESAVIDFQNGTTFYRKSNNNKFFGLTAGLVSKVEPIVDENGVRMGERVYIDHTSIDTRSNEYKLSAEGEAEDTVKTIVLDSIDPKYIANLKNNIEQKALYVVDDRAGLEALANSLNDEKKLESGVQFIVKHDDTSINEGHLIPDGDEFSISDSQPDEIDDEVPLDEATNLDTWLYAVSRIDGEVTETQDEETRVITVSNELGTFEIVPVMPLEYKFHDAVFVTNNGVNIVLIDNDEVENTRTYQVDNETTDTIIKAYTDASYLDVTRINGDNQADALKVIDAETGLTDAMRAAGLTEEKAFADGRQFNDVVTFTEKTYTFDGTRVVKSIKKSCIDFSDFVLDEGSWD